MHFLCISGSYSCSLCCTHSSFFFHIEDKVTFYLFFEEKLTFNWCDTRYGVDSWNPTLELISSSQKNKPLPFFSPFPFPLSLSLASTHSQSLAQLCCSLILFTPPIPRQQIFLLTIGRRQHPFGFGARTSHLIAISLSCCRLVRPNLFCATIRCKVVLLCNSVDPQ